MEQLDSATPNVPFLKRTAAHLSLLGLTHLGLYMEDTYPVPDQPFFGFGREPLFPIPAEYGSGKSGNKTEPAGKPLRRTIANHRHWFR